MKEYSGNWVNNSYTINTGASEVIKIKFSTETSSGVGTILIDDFVITEIKDPSYDGSRPARLILGTTCGVLPLLSWLRVTPATTL